MEKRTFGGQILIQELHMRKIIKLVIMQRRKRRKGEKQRENIYKKDTMMSGVLLLTGLQSLCWILVEFIHSLLLQSTSGGLFPSYNSSASAGGGGIFIFFISRREGDHGKWRRIVTIKPRSPSSSVELVVRDSPAETFPTPPPSPGSALRRHTKKAFLWSL